jgi:hypothetical protein
MFAVLIASVLFGLFMKPWERRKADAPPPLEAATANAAVQTVELVNAEIQYATSWPARDPFTRSDEYVVVHESAETEIVSIGEPTFALQGIMTIGGQMACVIDGKTHTVGSQYSGWRLDKIDAEGVWVSQGGERHFVPLP